MLPFFVANFWIQKAYISPKGADNMNIKIIRSDGNEVNEDALYEIFVNIILDIQAQEKEDQENS